MWVLRRFRDQVLTESAIGRFFITIYYMVSPRIVSVLGNTPGFRRISQRALDAFVAALRSRGVLDTPYSDRQVGGTLWLMTRRRRG